MVEKERTSITLDKRILEKARQEGINISEAAERGIIEALRKKKSVLNSENSGLDGDSSSSPSFYGSAGKVESGGPGGI